MIFGIWKELVSRKNNFKKYKLANEASFFVSPKPLQTKDFMLRCFWIFFHEASMKLAKGVADLAMDTAVLSVAFVILVVGCARNPQIRGNVLATIVGRTFKTAQVVLAHLEEDLIIAREILVRNDKK
ncbi:MAG: hypothetical protein US42_C0008G0028 [Candidatus Magasanikbacteria bacterium GW2011_GWC2_37_14]|uniref:Uncharacterized protein n=1 Tax=Candidatus Magasanikbacteria bacterium GW2011_GWC2_37_14 TaxID=1619046 RepID=A0A0G0GC10_9BACT|nr:MAG: hypothetical protein US42_C0008G0028 [Candidatus Magasanikbacteria bacterium GW2011_GWC2_37_14]